MFPFVLRITAPAIILCLCDPRFFGILENISEQDKQIGFIFHTNGVVAILEEVAGAVIFLIKINGVFAA